MNRRSLFQLIGAAFGARKVPTSPDAVLSLDELSRRYLQPAAGVMVESVEADLARWAVNFPQKIGETVNVIRPLRFNPSAFALVWPPVGPAIFHGPAEPPGGTNVRR